MDSDLPISHMAIMRMLEVILHNQLAIMKALPQQTVASMPGDNELHDRIKTVEEWMTRVRIKNDLS